MPQLPHDFWSFIRYFKSSEFSSPDDLITCNSMDYRLVIVLDNIRYFLKRAIIINRGYSTAKHNHDVGGVEDSSHLMGYAVDIHCPDDAFRYSLIFLAIILGIQQIGIYATHIHLGVDPGKTQGILWYGRKKETIN